MEDVEISLYSATLFMFLWVDTKMDQRSYGLATVLNIRTAEYTGEAV